MDDLSRNLRLGPDQLRPILSKKKEGALVCRNSQLTYDSDTCVLPTDAKFQQGLIENGTQYCILGGLPCMIRPYKHNDSSRGNSYHLFFYPDQQWEFYVDCGRKEKSNKKTPREQVLEIMALEEKDNRLYYTASIQGRSLQTEDNESGFYFDTSGDSPYYFFLKPDFSNIGNIAQYLETTRGASFKAALDRNLAPYRVIKDDLMTLLQCNPQRPFSHDELVAGLGITSGNGMRALDSLFETSNSHLLGLEGNIEILSIDGETKYRFLDRNALAAFERTIETYVRSHAGISFDEDQLIAALHIGQAEKDLFRQAFKSLAKRYKKNPRYDPGFHVEETQVITGTGKNKKTISKKHLRFLH